MNRMEMQMSIALWVEDETIKQAGRRCGSLAAGTYNQTRSDWITRFRDTIV